MAASSVSVSPSDLAGSGSPTSLAVMPTSLAVMPTSSFTTPPLNTPTPSPTGNGGGQGSGFGSNTNNPIGTSASLYLYTFLATLVLLLSVSAAIVVRSFLLRRRHRRMIEEAIRNGTWVPPAPSGRGPRVDLSKKPVMWEAYLGLNQTQNQNQQQQQQHYYQQQQQTQMSDEHSDWESMKPLMVTYVNGPVTNNAQNQNGGNVGSGGGGGGNGGNEVGGSGGVGAGNRMMGRLTASRRAVGGFAREVWSILRPSALGTPLPLNYPTANDTRQGSSTNLGNTAHSTGQDVPMSELGPAQPSKVRVAVLIAMPRPHSPHTSPSPSTSSTSGSTSTVAVAAASSSLSSQHITPPIHSQISTSSSSSLEEEELPHIEMGVAELVISDSHHLSSVNGEESPHHDGKGKVRESMASVGSV